MGITKISTIQTQSKRSSKNKNIDKVPPRENLSASEIRERLEASKVKKIEPKKVTKQAPRRGYLEEVDQDQLMKDRMALKQQKEVSATMKKSIEKGEEVFSDIKANDPNKPETHEKLKDVLNTGSFSFSSKEREVLNSILGQN